MRTVLTNAIWQELEPLGGGGQTVSGGSEARIVESAVSVTAIIEISQKLRR